MWRSKYRGMNDVDFPGELCELVAGWTGGYSFAYMKELFTASVLLSITHSTDEDQHDDGHVDEIMTQPSAVNGTTTSTEPAAAAEIPALPSSLQDNRMAKILRSQARALSNQIKAAPPTVKVPRGPSGPPPIRMPIISPLDQDD